MQALNSTVFLFFNAGADPAPLLVALARFLAERMIFVVAAAMVWGWVRGGADTRARLFSTGATIVIAILVNFSIAGIWDNPRPFAIGLGRQLLPHAPDSSFPSDHATVVFAVAFGLIAAQARVFWSALAMLVALAVAWSRVYLGIHWPLDMAGSFAVALIVALMVRRLTETGPVRAIRQGFLRAYDAMLNALGVPSALSPRAFAKDASR
jgi:undecaprenyl-diphosphatase